MKAGTVKETLQISESRKNAAIILNPAAGRANGMAVAKELCAHLDSFQVNYTLFQTDRPDHAREIAAFSLEGFDVVAGIGGDGTINEIINGLADSRSEIPLLPVAAGTANVVSKELGLPTDFRKLALLIKDSPVKKIDLGIVGNRRFVMCAGVGFDANIVREVSKKRGAAGITMLSYVVPFLKELFTYSFPRLEVVVDGQTVCDDATFVVVGNMRQYGGPFGFFNDAEVDDGLFEVCCFRGRSWLSLLKLGVVTFFKTLADSDSHPILKGSAITVHSKSAIATQLDGDCGGETPAAFKVLPKAVSFCIPAAE